MILALVAALLVPSPVESAWAETSPAASAHLEDTRPRTGVPLRAEPAGITSALMIDDSHAAARGDVRTQLLVAGVANSLGAEISIYLSREHVYDVVPQPAQASSVSNQRRGPPHSPDQVASDAHASTSWVGVAANSAGVAMAGVPVPKGTPT